MNQREDVIDRHVKVGQWLSDLPGTVREIRYRDDTLVTIDADPVDVTVKLGTPVEFVGATGRFLTWEHPEGFKVEVFVPADVS